MKPDCIIHPHDHRYQDRFTRCSARVRRYTHRTWTMPPAASRAGTEVSSPGLVSAGCYYSTQTHQGAYYHRDIRSAPPSERRNN